MSEKNIRIWQPVTFDQRWQHCDTSVLDDIVDSWHSRREVLQNNSRDYAEFMERLKREHAIETGIVERMYDLSRGVTDTFIRDGFVKAYLSHGDTNISEDTLLDHLNDHLEAVNFIFDVVKSSRPFTTGFIKELHQLVTRHQTHAEGRDGLGNKSKIPLLKGKFKEFENNPTREDGTKVLYCSPDHVDAEMDRLLEIYNELEGQKTHVLICATWFHHAFTTIHPFQDGNGRVARLLSSLILIKAGLFPFTVLREAKPRYIDALEKADRGEPQALITYFAETQRKDIERALNIREVSANSLEEAERIFSKKLEKFEKQKPEPEFVAGKERIYQTCYNILNKLGDGLKSRVGESTQISIGKSENVNYLIVPYAHEHGYYFNEYLPEKGIHVFIELPDKRKYWFITFIHSYGLSSTTIAVGFVLIRPYSVHQKRAIIPNAFDSVLSIPPHVLSISDNNWETKKKNIRTYLEEALTVVLAQIASEL